MTIPSGVIFPSSCPILRKGDYGKDVIILQSALWINGYTTDIDGGFGTKTEIMVKNFQTDHGLDPDGICGPKTWEAL